MRTRWFIFCGGVLSLAVGLMASSEPEPRRPEPAVADDEGPARRYRLDLAVRDEARLPAANGAAVPINAQVGLQSEIVVLERSAGVRRIRFEQVHAATLAIGDASKRASLAEMMEGLEALVVLDAGGAVRGVRVPPETSLAAERLVKLVVSELVWTSPRTGQGTERHRLGESEVTYAVEGPRAFVRTREGYRSWAAFDALDVRGLRAQIMGSARGTVDADGRLTSLRVDERVLGHHPSERQPVLRAEARLELELLGRPAAPRWTAAGFGPERSLAAHPTSEAAQANALKARIAGLTGPALVSALDRTGAAGEFADHAQMLARATALLRAEPALVGELAARFRAEGRTDAERTLLLDLLVGAGTPRAQAELRGLLQGPIVRSHPQRHLWDQRVSFVAAPTPETVRYAEQAFATRTGVDGTTAAYVLGAVADHLGRRGQAEAAAQATAPLLERLGAATDPGETAHLISALGNAGRPALVERIASHAVATQAEVRLAVAKALRKTDVEAARATLVRLSADPTEAVQRRALLSLNRMSTLSSNEMHALAASVRGAAVAEGSLAGLVNLMAGQPCSPARSAVLEAVRARPKEGGATLDHKTRLLESRCG